MAAVRDDPPNGSLCPFDHDDPIAQASGKDERGERDDGVSQGRRLRSV
jgi:hypothetical protein